MLSNEKISSILNSNLERLGITHDYLLYELFLSELLKVFYDYGYPFNRQAAKVKFIMNKKIIAEVDLLLEDGDYLMPVEVKTSLSKKDVDWHLERLEKIRMHMDSRSDKRILVGAVAGGVFEEGVIDYAHENGLYVAIQSGDNVAIADTPQSFRAREW